MIKRKKINPALQIVLGFLAVILIGTLLLALPISSKDGQGLSIFDCLFTSSSAVCVTGLSVFNIGLQFTTFGQIIILLLIQIGGLGFITLTALVFLLLGKKITYERRVTIKESFNQENVQGIVKLVKNVIILVFVIELFGFLCLAPSLVSFYGWGKGLFNSLFLSISAFCNAGFDVLGEIQMGESLSAFAQNSIILLPIMFLIVIGGIGYIVLFDVGAKFKGKKMSFHSKVVLTISSILIFGGAVAFALLEWNNPLTIGNMSTWDKIVNSTFQSVTPRTAGFSTFNQIDMSAGSVILTIIFMFIGGSPASTAGGIKTVTLFVLFLAVFKNPNVNGNISFCRKKISSNIVRKSLRVIVLAITIVCLSSFAIAIAEGGRITVLQTVFEVVSALSTVGLSLNITASLCAFSKVVLITLMFVGRVGAVTLTLAFVNKNTGISQSIEYIDSKLMVG